MSNDTIVSLSDPAFADELSDLVRAGAQRIIKQAVAAELEAFLAAHGDTDAACLPAGRQAGARSCATAISPSARY